MSESVSPELPPGLLVAWYGDDFTGSAAVMEVLTFAGLPSVLFLDTPTREVLAAFPGMRGIGIAGTARAHGPDWMERELPSIYRCLAALGAPVLHYKCCSTLDSAPHVGSIGKAIDLAFEIIRPSIVPLLVAAPAIRRYQAFGNLFAAAPEGVFRLDRHPVMARHPVTPMDEADVCAHLARQTQRPMSLVDLVALRSDASADDALARARSSRAEIVGLDTVDARTLAAAGRLIWSLRGDGSFVVGSQGVEYALVDHWLHAGLIERADEPGGAASADRIAVVSGSVSPVTAGQIDWALAHGFAGIAFDASSVAGTLAARSEAENEAVRAALDASTRGRDPLVYTARGPDDPAVERYRAAIARADLADEDANQRVGEALGRILEQILREGGIRRAVIAGGDTSGHVTRRLGVVALTALAPTIPGAALFQAHVASDSGAPVAGVELALKGGQMGTPDYFGWIKAGGGAGQMERKP